MAFPLLVSVSDALEAMGQNPDLMEESTPAIASAIVRATLKLETVLKTCLRPQSRVDTFYVSGLDGSPINTRYKLRLTNGVVAADPAVSVSLIDSNGREESMTSGFSVDYDKGIVSVVASTFAEPQVLRGRVGSTTDYLLGKHIRVAYSSGFDSQEKTPMEVQQAILCLVPSMLLSTSQAVTDPKQQQAAASKSASLDALSTDMVSLYLRLVGNVLKPVSSILVE